LALLGLGPAALALGSLAATLGACCGMCIADGSDARKLADEQANRAKDLHQLVQGDLERMSQALREPKDPNDWTALAPKSTPKGVGFRRG
jgi:hypothetical protein